MLIAIQTLSFIIIIASFLPLWKTEYWWIRVLDFPRLQLLTVSIICLFGQIIFGWTQTLDLALTLGLIAAIGLDWYRIYPYLPMAEKESLKVQDYERQDHDFSLISVNVYIENRQVNKLIEMLSKERPDILLLLEPDDWWEEALRSLEAEYPHNVKIPQDNTYGMLLYSRLPLKNVSIRHLVDERVPSIFTEVQLRSGEWIQLIALHPRPPRPKEGHSDERDAELMKVAKRVERKSTPTIVVGDLNDVAWSHTTRLFLRTSGMLDPRRGRGFYSTFPTKYPFFRFPLDHIFHTKSLSLVTLRVLKDIGSDHFPIKVRLALTKTNENEANVKDKGDEKEVQRMLKKGQEWDGPNETLGS